MRVALIVGDSQHTTRNNIFSVNRFGKTNATVKSINMTLHDKAFFHWKR